MSYFKVDVELNMEASFNYELRCTPCQFASKARYLSHWPDLVRIALMQIRMLYCVLAAFAMSVSIASPVTAQTQSIDFPTSEDEDRDPDVQLTLSPAYSECSRDQDAAIISGEIVVCRRLEDGSDNNFSSKEEAQYRYAERTKGISTPDVEGGTIHAPGSGLRGCYIPPCPRPSALMIDIPALPEAPPGSDADRISRGLAPQGSSGTTAREQSPQDENTRSLMASDLQQSSSTPPKTEPN